MWPAVTCCRCSCSSAWSNSPCEQFQTHLLYLIKWPVCPPAPRLLRPFLTSHPWPLTLDLSGTCFSLCSLGSWLDPRVWVANIRCCIVTGWQTKQRRSAWGDMLRCRLRPSGYVAARTFWWILSNQDRDWDFRENNNTKHQHKLNDMKNLVAQLTKVCARHFFICHFQGRPTPPLTTSGALLHRADAQRRGTVLSPPTGIIKREINNHGAAPQ